MSHMRPFGIMTTEGWWEILYADNHTANMDANYKLNNGDFTECQVVELVPMPEVERLVAEAVAAANEEWLEKRHDAQIEMRDRCAAIAEEHATGPCDPQMATERDLGYHEACVDIMRAIREVTP